MRRWYILIGVVCIVESFCYGMRIPLSGQSSGPTAAAGGVRIGMVDMEIIFREFPETRRGQQDLEKEIQNARITINTKQQAIDALQEEVQEMQTIEDKTGHLPGMDLTADTTAQTAPDTSPESDDDMEIVEVSDEPDSKKDSQKDKKKKKQDEKDFKKLLDEKTQELAELKKELEEFKKESEINLLEFEERKSREILEKLYRVLTQIAREEKFDIILDKNYVLYGQPAVDVTEKVKRRLAGD